MPVCWGCILVYSFWTGAIRWGLHCFLCHPAISARTEIVNPGSTNVSLTNDGGQILLLPLFLLRALPFSELSGQENRMRDTPVNSNSSRYCTVSGSPDEGLQQSC
ncbi:hypothetical protein BDP81DRAFT_123053 [Colletotrichum phormii]|uniref:Secreted protein n=1 Tax=Colletotrichum phormii TaxID=359342 RepID=A0AAI9ZYX5_9PEZI|nr:uncharacterized protein BDP81DRAFT_123053 [Colletotrichum phormii]KAK1640797.1 hypothetical protein BDP81DRAFT_123053 [Colletotrichum phormii]